MANIDNEEDELEFHEMGLDDRILKVLSSLIIALPQLYGELGTWVDVNQIENLQGEIDIRPLSY